MDNVVLSLQTMVLALMLYNFWQLNRKPITHPTFVVITESRFSLAEVMKTKLDILSAASCYKYGFKYIIRKFDFVMTGSTATNLKVIEKVNKISLENCFSLY